LGWNVVWIAQALRTGDCNVVYFVPSTTCRDKRAETKVNVGSTQYGMLFLQWLSCRTDYDFACRWTDCLC
jgi:hypothetical protein